MLGRLTVLLVATALAVGACGDSGDRELGRGDRGPDDIVRLEAALRDDFPRLPSAADFEGPALEVMVGDETTVELSRRRFAAICDAVRDYYADDDLEAPHTAVSDIRWGGFHPCES
ncbi:MAG: hypothetical protein QOJ89_3962 [bacterium]|jgi:hypothetical protein